MSASFHIERSYRKKNVAQGKVRKYYRCRGDADSVCKDVWFLCVTFWSGRLLHFFLKTILKVDSPNNIKPEVYEAGFSKKLIFYQDGQSLAFILLNIAKSKFSANICAIRIESKRSEKNVSTLSFA